MKMLDLFCGEGLASWGYWRSGRFSEIVGVDWDNKMSSRYSFNFVCANVRALDYDFLMSFDFIHASPPCQAYSKITPDRTKHVRLIAATHLMLQAVGKPYVIENVEGSGRELRPNLVMNGTAVGLPCERRRYFYASGLKACRLLIRGAGTANIRIHGASATKRADVIKAMGLEILPERQLERLTVHGMEQGIPPLMTKRIAEMMFPDYKATVG